MKREGIKLKGHFGYIHFFGKTYALSYYSFVFSHKLKGYDSQPWLRFLFIHEIYKWMNIIEISLIIIATKATPERGHKWQSLNKHCSQWKSHGWPGTPPGLSLKPSLLLSSYVHLLEMPLFLPLPPQSLFDSQGVIVQAQLLYQLAEVCKEALRLQHSLTSLCSSQIMDNQHRIKLPRMLLWGHK